MKQVFEIQGPDGTVYEVEAESLEQAVSAFNPETFAQASQNATAIEALERLEASGDLRPAEAEALQALRSGQPGAEQIMGETGATYRGAVQGATFNFADEIGGLVGMDKEGIRTRNELAERLYPERYRAGKTAGALASGVATAPLWSRYIGAAKSLPGLMGRSAVAGGTEGAIYGAGEGEGAMDRVPGAMRNGALGAAVGAAAPPAVSLTLRGAQGVSDALMGGVDAAINRGSNTRARRAIAEALQRSGRTGQDVASAVSAAAREGQPEFRMMDAMGVAGQRLANGVVRAGGDGSEEIAQFLSQRQLDQGDRMAGFVTDAFGAQKTAAQTTEELARNRGNAADAAYSAARGNATPVDVRGAVDVIDARIGGMAGSNVAGDSIDGRLQAFRNRLIADPAPDGEISRELSDFSRVLGVKQDVSDAIGAAVRAGRNNEARELTRLRDALDEALEQASPDYRQANDEFAAASRVISAVDEGAQMARPGVRAEDTTQRFAAMTPEQQAAARVGYADRALARIEANPAPTADKSRPFRSTKVATESDAMAVDAPLFQRRVQREGDMWETQNRALGGSRTADNLQDIGNTGPMADLFRAARDVGNLQFGQAAQNLGAAVSPYMTGRNEATRKLIADMLMSAQASNVLAPVQASQAREALLKRLLEGGVRGAGREVTP